MFLPGVWVRDSLWLRVGGAGEQRWNSCLGVAGDCADGEFPFSHSLHLK